MEILSVAAIFLAGIVIGVLTVLLVNKLRSGSVSPTRIKKEKEDYQAQVEAHFEETSRKFKQMATQYQDLYTHLSVGATTLCRPENIAPGLSDQRDPLAADAKPETKSPKIVASQAPSAAPASGKSANDLKSESKSDAKPKSDAKNQNADKPTSEKKQASAAKPQPKK